MKYNINDEPERFNKHMEILTEWIVRVYDKYKQKISKQNLKCISNIIEHFVQNNGGGQLEIKNLQMYGCVSASIVKYIFKPDGWIKISDNAFTVDQFISLIDEFTKIYIHICPEAKMLTTNRRCTKKIDNFEKRHEVLHKCSIFSDIKLTEILGEGSFGIVYLGEATYNESPKNKQLSPLKKKQVAVKFIKSGENFEDLNLEIAYSYNMGILGLGPKIYDAFYTVDKDENYKQVIIMDYYKYSGKNALKIANKKQAIDIITQMIKLINYMIFSNKMYCVDIKPENFIVNENLDDVKLIDFGSDWCTPQLMTDNEHQLFQIILFQLYSMINNSKLTDTELTDIFCNYFSPPLIHSLEKFYNNSNDLIIKHYVQKSKVEVINLATDIISRCKKSHVKRKSPSPTRHKKLISPASSISSPISSRSFSP